MQELPQLQDFRAWLQKVIDRLNQQDRGGAHFADMQLRTGLRAVEVLEFSRWTDNQNGTLTVQLAKREATRTFNKADLPPFWLAALQAPKGHYSYSYSSYVHDLNGTGISFIFNGDTRCTLSHAFRYYKFRELYALFGNVAQVQTEMAHISRGSTMYYLLDTVNVQDKRAF